MTREKDLKRKVRARMAKTGETYSTARAHLVRRGDPFGAPVSIFGGAHGETAALRGLFGVAGVVDPDTGEPLSEAALLGIGGGLGAAYFVFEYAGHPPTLYIGTRVGHQAPYTAEFAAAVCERLGVSADVVETGGKKAAAAALRRLVAERGAAIAWADRASLPHTSEPAAMAGATPHVVLVTEVDDDAATATLYDVSAAPYTVDAAALDEARARLRKAKNRVLSVGEGAVAGDVGAAMRAGLRACVASLRDGALVERAAGNFGLDALAKWADLAADTRGKKAWRRVFGPGRPLYVGLRRAYFWIEAAGTGGGGFRPMYAAFLDEAAARLGAGALGDVAERYRALGRQWTSLARSLLPDDVPALAETRQLVDAKRAAIERGPAGAADIAAIDARLAAIEASMDAAFPLDAAAAEAVYADLASRLRALVGAEREAVDALEAVL